MGGGASKFNISKENENSNVQDHEKDYKDVLEIFSSNAEFDLADNKPFFDRFADAYKKSSSGLIKYLDRNWPASDATFLLINNDEECCLIEIMAELGATEVFKFIIDKYVIPQEEGDFRRNCILSTQTALHIAAAKNNSEICEYILDKFPDLLESNPEVVLQRKDYIMKDKYTPLIAATHNGSYECCMLFMYKGADLDKVLKHPNEKEIFRGKENLKDIYERYQNGERDFEDSVLPNSEKNSFKPKGAESLSPRNLDHLVK